MHRAIRPASPLIRVLERLSSPERASLRTITIHQLGYRYSGSFCNAEQLYRWLKPSAEIYGSYPAGSYQLGSFTKRLTVNDLFAHCEVVRDWVRARYS